MKSEIHIKNSLERLKERDYTGLYSLAPKVVEEIVTETHKTLDSFFIPSKDSKNMLKHRAKLHHEEGIKIITKRLTKQYGELYMPLIKREAEEHVKEDMGYIPRKNEYKTKNFWDNWIERNETIMGV